MSLRSHYFPRSNYTFFYLESRYNILLVALGEKARWTHKMPRRIGQLLIKTSKKHWGLIQGYIVRFGQCSVFLIPINKRQPLEISVVFSRWGRCTVVNSAPIVKRSWNQEKYTLPWPWVDQSDEAFLAPDWLFLLKPPIAQIFFG
jgi:hypothetical protein